ncbi:MAG TPA: NAD(P)H-binding protein [Chthoniobacterales bacterium]
MTVLTTPTGNIGSQVLKNLLAANAAVRVIARDPAKLAPEVHGKAEIVQGSIDDQQVLTRAFAGAESVFLIVPPSFTDKNDTEYYLRFTRPACRAVRSQGVKRVVGVSVLGRGTSLAKNAGPITASLAKGEEIERTGVDYRALWCPALMENMLGQAQALKHQGMFFMPASGDFKTPQVAARDVAASGAKLLLDLSWTGQGGLAVLGPEDLSFNDMAAIMTEVLGKPIRFESVPADGYKAQLMQYGANEVFAQGIVDMMAAKDKGMDNTEPRTAENTTPTGFRQWCEEVLKPAVLG